MSRLMTAAVIAMLAAVPASAKQAPRAPANPGELMLFQETNFNGEAYTIETERTSVKTDWNIRSIGMHPGESWQICAKPRFRECIVLKESLADASLVGIQGQIGSARRAPAGQ